MVSSTGNHLVLTTFGESASPYVGAIVDGIPAGLPISAADIAFELSFRKTGRKLVSGRREEDVPEIISGTFYGYTTGAPLTVTVKNSDPQPTLYAEIRPKPRPRPADLSFIRKYGIENWDYVGGGRSSARETLSRVIGGTVAKKLLMLSGTQVAAYLASVGNMRTAFRPDFDQIMGSKKFPTRAASSEMDARFAETIEELVKVGDSTGGIVEAVAHNVPAGLGDPVFHKLKSLLASAIMSIPAVTGFEYGLGFASAGMKGSEAGDSIVLDEGGTLKVKENLSGGMLGGISTGSDIVARCAFKPTSSIRKPMKTIDLRTMEPAEISVVGRHDPVVAVRGVAVVEAMMALVLADQYIVEGLIPASRIDRGKASRMEESWQNYRKRFAQ